MGLLSLPLLGAVLFLSFRWEERKARIQNRLGASHWLEEFEMAKFALYAELKAKPGKEADVEAFLKQGAEMAKAEAGTVHWYGFKEDKGGFYGVFDTFNDEAGRDAHLNGEIAKALMANAETLFSEAPKIHKISLIAEKV
jgi:quinol monooxygenase YgiN